MWQRDKKWANAAGKMALTAWLNAGHHKPSICKNTPCLRRATHQAMPVYTSITLYFSFIVLILTEFLFSSLYCKLHEVTLLILYRVFGAQKSQCGCLISISGRIKGSLTNNYTPAVALVNWEAFKQPNLGGDDSIKLPNETISPWIHWLSTYLKYALFWKPTYKTFTSFWRETSVHTLSIRIRFQSETLFGTETRS